jgi:hypothetical protein
MYITLNIVGITQGCNNIGYDFENELKNLSDTNQNLLICSPTVIPMGTDVQTDGQTNKQTDIYLLKYSGISSHYLMGVGLLYVS